MQMVLFTELVCKLTFKEGHAWGAPGNDQIVAYDFSVIYITVIVNTVFHQLNDIVIVTTEKCLSYACFNLTGNIFNNWTIWKHVGALGTFFRHFVRYNAFLDLWLFHNEHVSRNDLPLVCRPKVQLVAILSFLKPVD